MCRRLKMLFFDKDQKICVSCAIRFGSEYLIVCIRLFDIYGPFKQEKNVRTFGGVGCLDVVVLTRLPLATHKQVQHQPIPPFDFSFRSLTQ